MKKTILIYDDNDQIILLFKIILKSYNYNYFGFSNCSNLLKDLKYHKPDLIMMDLNLPGMSGDQAIYAIKNYEAFVHIPILLISTDSRIAENYPTLPVNGYLTKPFKLNEFKECLERFL